MKTHLRFSTLVLLLFLVARVTSQCALEGYNYAGTFNGHQYYVSAGNSTWVQANADAVASGGYLATISSASENTFVAGIGQTWGFDPGEVDEGQWIGINDVETEGVFVWANGEPTTYTSWGFLEPNNSGNEDFTEINRGGFGMWNDLPDWVDRIEAILEVNDADCDGVGDACDEVFNDIDCDGIGDGCDSEFLDSDCDGIGDGCDTEFLDSDCDGIADDCDNCDGGDDNGPCNATAFPGFNNIPADWVCHDNGRKVFMCHDGNTICIDASAVPAHLAHGDFLGPCTDCGDRGYAAPLQKDAIVMESNDIKPTMTVYPNPSQGDFSINMDKYAGTINVYNQRGMLVQQVQGQPYEQLDLEVRELGSYTIQLITEKGIVTKKLTVLHR